MAETQTTTTDTTTLGAPTAVADTTIAPTPGTTDTTAATTAPVVPDKYDFTLPEGQSLDPAAVDQATTVFRELKLTNEQAQKIVDLQMGMQKQQLDAYESMVGEWAQQITKDPVVGGAKHAENVEMARRAVLRLEQIDPGLKLREVFNELGVGNHPVFVRAFYQIGKLLSEDKTTVGAPAAPQAKRPEEILYRNTPTA